MLYRYGFMENDLHCLEISKRIISLFKRKKVFFSNNESSRLQLGDFIFIDKNTIIEPYSGFLSGNYLSSFGAFSYSWSELPVSMKVGRYCSIAGGLRIHGPRHPIEALTTSSIAYDTEFLLIKTALKNIELPDNYPLKLSTQAVPIIENDVWIGSNVTLAPGIRLSTGSIVAAESVVTRDVPPYAIVGGNPAKVIRWRFSEHTRDLLLETKWWRYHYKDIFSCDFSSPEAFLEKFLERKKNLAIWRPRPIKYDDIIKL